MISKELLEILVCPDDRTPLTLADETLVARLNRLVGAGKLKNKAGDAVERPLDGGLLRNDGSAIYPIIDGIPILLIDEAIPLDSLSIDGLPGDGIVGDEIPAGGGEG